MSPGKFRAINAYIFKEARSPISNLNFHLKKADKEKLQASEKREIIEIKAEINER